MPETTGNFDFSKGGDINYCVHKLNNMLSVIQGNAELLKMQNKTCEEVEDILTCCSISVKILQTILRENR